MDFFRPYLAHASIGVCCAVARFHDGKIEVWSHSQSIFAAQGHCPFAWPAVSTTSRSITRRCRLLRPQRRRRCRARCLPGCARLSTTLRSGCNGAARTNSAAVRSRRRCWSRSRSAVDDDGTILSAGNQDIYGNGHLLRPGNFEVPSLLAASEMARPLFQFRFRRTPRLPRAAAPIATRSRSIAPAALHVDVHRMLEMPLRTSSLRGLGAMINVLAIESTMDELAAAGRPRSGRLPAVASRTTSAPRT